MSYLIDANIFLEVELGQEKGLESKVVLTKFRNGELYGVITDFLDFDDGLTYQCVKEHGIEIIISYDVHFDRLRDIKRLTPGMILRDIR